jgi:hypothetical protein
METIEADFLVQAFAIERIPGYGDSVTVRLAGKSGLAGEPSEAEKALEEMEQGAIYHVEFTKRVN